MTDTTECEELAGTWGPGVQDLVDLLDTASNEFTLFSMTLH